MSEFNQARREGIVKFGYDFNSLAEVTHLWGLSATKLPYRVAFKIPGRENARVLLLSEEGGDGWRNLPFYGEKTDGCGWHEIVEIAEGNSDWEKSMRRVKDELKNPLERYVFWRECRDGVAWYKFYGVFKLDVEKTRASKDSGAPVCYYHKVSDVGECLKCDVEPRAVGDDEFLSLAGKVLSTNLLDTVSYEVNDKDRTNGDVKVWPGQKFVVKSVSPMTAICETTDDDVLAQIKSAGKASFAIPKRDIELGYFTVRGER